MGQEIELYSRLQDPIQAIDKMGEWFSGSGLFGCNSPAAGKILALVCVTERLTPLQISRRFDICDNRLRQKALSLLADFRKAGGKHEWLKDGSDGKEAVLRLTPPDGKPLESRFTMEDAQRQNLVRKDSNWVKSPGNMLRARAISNGVAMLMPEILTTSPEDDDEVTNVTATAAGPQKAQIFAETPKAESKKEEPKVVDAEIVKVDLRGGGAESKPNVPGETATAGAPQVPSTGTIAPFQVSVGANGKITEATNDALLDVIGAGNVEAAVAWLKAKRWVMESLSDIRPERAQQVLNNPAGFLAQVKAATSVAGAATK